jgi:hypothetical protein
MRCFFFFEISAPPPAANDDMVQAIPLGEILIYFLHDRAVKREASGSARQYNRHVSVTFDRQDKNPA